ncbi:MAG: restriction endonuclease subunit S [Methylotenera sp.]|nr:restriction endonuclease subunit S [Methylotenera sp.]
MSKYKAYPEYKDSVVEWLEKIPEHWGASKLRYMFSFGKGLTITKEDLLDDGLPCVNYGEVHSKYGFEVDPAIHPLKCVSEHYLKSSPSSLLSKGDLVFADTSEDIEGSGNFTQSISDQTFFAGYHTIIARPKDRKNSRFYAYLFDSQEFRTQIRYAVKGVKVFSITQAILRGTHIWLPTLIEQEKIANFLDHETAKIDTLIEKQQLLIKLLKEKRQAVISHAVTKGLNLNAPMRDSGVEWLGEVPAHWEVKKLKFACSFITKKVDIENKKTIALENIESWTGKYIATDSVYSGEDVEFKSGDILFGKLRPYLAKVYFAEEDGVAFGDLLVYRSKRNFLGKYCFYQMINEAFINTVDSSTYGSKMPRASADFINEMEVLLPPFQEQEEIVNYIESVLTKFNEIETKAKSAINLMQERRTALISAAVTGKIDVRKWLAPAL